MAEDVNARIDDFVSRTREMTGKEVREREPWNSEASADAIRHFVYGIDDGNPLCLNPEYAANSRYGKLVAPPPFPKRRIVVVFP
ncbi:MAG: MaoC family dehydratase N-terminal domain-containing protein [Deltaproteobacteria bacterium]|nr:MaoC family dehydratase N-terminal domain-containing protein [Deltaproteobacteria bacterium]